MNANIFRTIRVYSRDSRVLSHETRRPDHRRVAKHRGGDRQDFREEIRGVRLAFVARNATKLGAVARACAKLGATAEIFACDVANEAAVAALAKAVAKKFGGVDVLINNAARSCRRHSRRRASRTSTG